LQISADSKRQVSKKSLSLSVFLPGSTDSSRMAIAQRPPMPFDNRLEQSRQAREKSKRFQEEALQQRHNVAKRDSAKTPRRWKEPGIHEEGAYFI